VPRYKYLDDTPHVFVDLQATPEQQADAVLSGFPGRVLQPGEEFEHAGELAHGLIHKLDVAPTECVHCVGSLPPAPEPPAEQPSAVDIPAESPVGEPALD
jgi:hypothetical protein